MSKQPVWRCQSWPFAPRAAFQLPWLVITTLPLISIGPGASKLPLSGCSCGTVTVWRPCLGTCWVFMEQKRGGRWQEQSSHHPILPDACVSFFFTLMASSKAGRGTCKGSLQLQSVKCKLWVCKTAHLLHGLDCSVCYHCGVIGPWAAGEWTLRQAILG